MDAELEKYDTCDWKKYMHKLIPNLWTLMSAVRCAICGLWTNVHNLWTTMRSLCLKKENGKIVLYSNLGDHCSVTDSDTTYSLSKTGSTIKLTGSDGSVDSVTDDNTTYGLSRNDHTVTLVAGGTNMSVTIPDNDTKYGLSRDGHTVTIVEGGTNHSVTIPDNNTTYSLSKNSSGVITLTGSDGSTSSVQDDDHTRIGVTLYDLTINGLAGNATTGEVTISSSQLPPPSGIDSYKMFGLVGYSSDHYQVVSAGSFVSITAQTLTYQFTNTSSIAITDAIHIQFHIAWYRSDAWS